MQLRNKKTGEIVELLEIVRIDDVSNEFYLRLSDNEGRTFKVGFNSLAELNAEWKDYEEPKEYWYIDYDGGILCGETDGLLAEKMMKSIGNHFNTLEEAKKAVEKLKAVKRLKDKGFKFDEYHIPAGEIHFNMSIQREDMDDFIKDMNICFGGEG